MHGLIPPLPEEDDDLLLRIIGIPVEEDVEEQLLRYVFIDEL